MHEYHQKHEILKIAHFVFNMGSRPQKSPKNKKRESLRGKVSWEKKTCFFFILSKLPFPPPIWTTCSDVKIQDLKVSLELKNTIWYTIYIQPKTVQSSKNWHFGGNRLLLLTKNCQEIWEGSSPPSFGQNLKEQQFFLRIPSLGYYLLNPHVQAVQKMYAKGG